MLVIEVLGCGVYAGMSTVTRSRDVVPLPDDPPLYYLQVCSLRRSQFQWLLSTLGAIFEPTWGRDGAGLRLFVIRTRVPIVRTS